jgi:hypothetical protein
MHNLQKPWLCNYHTVCLRKSTLKPFHIKVIINHNTGNMNSNCFTLPWAGTGAHLVLHTLPCAPVLVPLTDSPVYTSVAFELRTEYEDHRISLISDTIHNYRPPPPSECLLKLRISHCSFDLAQFLLPPSQHQEAVCKGVNWSLSIGQDVLQRVHVTQRFMRHDSTPTPHPHPQPPANWDYQKKRF